MHLNRNLPLSAAFLGMLVFGICLISLGSVMPFLSETYQLEELTKGTLATLLPVGILVGSLIFGPVVDRYSFRIMLTASTLIAASGILIIGSARSVTGLYPAFFLIGLGGGMLNGSTSALVSDLSTAGGHQKGANLSLLGVFFGIGALGMPVILGMLPESSGYRKGLLWIGSSVCLPALYFLLIPYPLAKQEHFRGFSTWRSLLRKKLIILAGLILFIQSGMESLVNNWSTTYFIEGTGLARPSALFCLTLFVLVFTMTRLVLKFLLRIAPAGMILKTGIVVAMAGCVLFYFSRGEEAALFSVVFMGIGLASGFPLILGFVGDAFPEWSGSAFSIVFTIGIIGNALINYLMGWLTGTAGMNALPVALLISMILFAMFLFPLLKNIQSMNQ